MELREEGVEPREEVGGTGREAMMATKDIIMAANLNSTTLKLTINRSNLVHTHYESLHFQSCTII